ncbi:hypothetical protein Tco_1546845 [Tanacetum coccineum]
MVDKDDETLVLVSDEALDVGDGATFNTVGNVPSELTTLSNMPISKETMMGGFQTVSFEEITLHDNLFKVAEKAKANGAKKMVQVTAKKSYAKVREELEECLTRNKLTRKELFPACFSKDT